jgi:amidase
VPHIRQFGQPSGPTPDQVARYAERLGLHFTTAEVEVYTATVAATMAIYERVEQLPEPSVPLRHLTRDPGHVPTAEEDPYNAFTRLCEVRGADHGPLAGKTVAVKDCIAVAGVPVTDGGRRMPYLVPTEDAVVVERLLDAGATIIGKTNMEDLALGVGEGSHFGAALNPHDPRFSTGGSSSGSGAAVAAGMADIGIGADEGGSVRIPAAWCGLVGMKATHGLVPSYGMSYMDHTIDHIGPITRTVEENARVLEVISGGDWRDPQWVRNDPVPGAYLAAAEEGISGLRIGVVVESLEPSGTTPDVRTAFDDAVGELGRLGAQIIPVSFPMWTDAAPILLGALGVAVYGMWLTHGAGFGHLGRIDPNAVATVAAHNRLGADDFPPMLKSSLLCSMHVRDAYLGVPFAKAQNLRIEMRRALSACFADVDLLVTPTIPAVPFELLDRKGTLAERLGRTSMSAVANTCQLDLTGHPAITVPSGRGDRDLPVGLQIIGPHFGEALCYRAAFAYESVAPEVAVLTS